MTLLTVKAEAQLMMMLIVNCYGNKILEALLLVQAKK